VIIILKGMKICLILCVWLTCLKYHLETKSSNCKDSGPGHDSVSLGEWFLMSGSPRIIIIILLITFLSIYLVGNLHLSQTVGGIRLSQVKEIHPIP